jgi:hypothetical protein
MISLLCCVLITFKRRTGHGWRNSWNNNRFEKENRTFRRMSLTSLSRQIKSKD